jgi:hypothetical protein
MKKIIFLFLLTVFFTLSIKAQEALKADAGENQHFCFGTDWVSTILGGNPTASGGVPPYTYLWWSNSGGIYISDEETTANPRIDFLGENIVYVRVTDAVDNTDIDSVVITMSSQQLNFSNDPQYLQMDYFIHSGDSVFLKGNVLALNPNSSFSWSPCESIISDCLVSDGFFAKPLTTTNYYLTAKDEHHCSETFFTHFYRVFVDEVGITDCNSEYSIEIYPNPVSKFLNIEIVDEPNILTSNIEIFDIYGQKIFASKMEEKTNILNLLDWTNGVYFLKLQINNSVFCRKIIKI